MDYILSEEQLHFYKDGVCMMGPDWSTWVQILSQLNVSGQGLVGWTFSSGSRLIGLLVLTCSEFKSMFIST